MIQNIWDRYQSIFFYLFFGVLTTVVDWIVYKVLMYVGLDYIPSNVIAWACAVLFAFVTNKWLVFDSHELKFAFVIQEFLRFVAARVFSLLFQMGGIILMTEYLHVHEDISKAVMAVLVVISNYVLSKLLVFQKKS